MTHAGSATGPQVALDEGFDAATLPLLRGRVAACAAAMGLPVSRTADVTLAIHELAANAVRHGPGRGRLQMRGSDGKICCRVSDAGPGPDHWPLRQGHGLWIVRQIADHLDMSSGPDGSAVTAVFTSSAEPGGTGDEQKI